MLLLIFFLGTITFQSSFKEANQKLEKANKTIETLKIIQAQHIKEYKEGQEERKKVLSENVKLYEENQTLIKYRPIRDVNEELSRLKEKSLEVQREIKSYKNTLTAIKNHIEGYGDRYIIPRSSLVDELAEEYGYKKTAEGLKDIRKAIRRAVKDRRSAKSTLKDQDKKDAAINLITEAFNGKVESILTRVKQDNYGKLHQEIIDVYNLLNYNGSKFSSSHIDENYLALRLEELRLMVVVMELRAQEKEEQRQIKTQMREEARAQREIEKAIKEAKKEEKILQEAMAKVRKEYEDASEEQKAMYEDRLAEMEQKVKEAEERNQRAISMAQQTKRGHVYVISNIGSFGEDVYKIGMTRRLEPLDRIKELGDASVPFEFDVHAMIWSEDAPSLENALHRHFALAQVNKVNRRKEFFRASLQEIRRQVDEIGVETKWTIAAEAKEYQESQAIDRLIKEDPQAKEDWLNRELTLEDFIDLNDDEIEELEEGGAETEEEAVAAD
ncbi:DUF4041 domain-containing protein [Dethiosulfovibrio sp. F2B]|uniref:DUF4041 domain-containing protein n=1 Tax=Dethiosulfovibrio faecalis TaxID=2720018 RepID=UPI001F1E2A9A|nr:DUF4041 domain-containing protein [Dethiosulfovibrio faecalis]